MYHGDIALGSTIDIKFTTRSFTTGAPTTLAGTPVISAYLSNDVTQLTAGITLSVDFDGVTGLNNVRIVATSGNGYATATDYTLVVTTGTVGGVSVVGECIGSFSIANRSALRPTTAGLTLDVSATGEAGVDWANVGSPTTALNLSATNFDVDQVVASVSGAVGSVAGLTAATVHSDLDDIQARLPAALTTNGNMKSSLVEILTTALTETLGLLAGGFKKFFNVVAPVSTMDQIAAVTLVNTLTTYTGNTLQTANVATLITTVGVAGAGLTALGDTRIANLDATVSSRTKPADTQARVTLVDTLTTYTGNTPQTGDVFPLASTEIADIKAKTDLIPAAPAAVGDIPTAAVIADAVWDEAKSGHTTDTTFGDLATDLNTVAVDVAGLDGAAMRGTDSAALATVCTEARLSELDAGTPGKAAAEVDLIKGYTDDIGIAGAGLTALGDVRIANLDATVSSRGTSTLTQTQVTGGAYTVQSASCVLGDARIANLDATISSRTKPADTQAAVTVVGSVSGAVGSVTGLTASNLDATISSRTKPSDTQAAVTTVTTLSQLTAAAAESYATDGSTATPIQLLYMIWALLAEANVASTTLTAKKLDGSTSAMTFTLNDSVNPTAITRAS